MTSSDIDPALGEGEISEKIHETYCKNLLEEKKYQNSIFTLDQILDIYRKWKESRL